MFNQVKALKLADLNVELAQVEMQKDAMSKKINDALDQLWSLENEQSRGVTGKKDFSWFERNFTQRKEYQLYQSRQARFDALPGLIEQAKQVVAIARADVAHEMETTGLQKQYDDLHRALYTADQAQTLSDLGITPAAAIQMLEAQNIPAVLDESDYVTAEHPRNFTTKSSLIGVHRTHYMPNDNLIKSGKDAEAIINNNVVLDHENYRYQYQSPRETVHMAFNSEVSSHAYGDWDSCEYTVLVPFDEIPNESIGRATTMDTFTRGSLRLGKNAWIICPANEVEKVKQANPGLNVAGYVGDQPKGLGNAFLTQLNYRHEPGNAWGWDDHESAQQFSDLMARENIQQGAHSFTSFAEDETALSRINQAVALAGMLRDQQLMKTPDDVARITEQLDQQGHGFRSILSEVFKPTEFPDDVEATSIVGNHLQLDVMFQRFAAAGLEILPIYQVMLRQRFARMVGEPFDLTQANLAPEEKTLVEQLKSAPMSTVLNCAMGDAVIDAQTKTRDRGPLISAHAEPYLNVVEPQLTTRFGTDLTVQEKAPAPEVAPDELILW